MNNRMAVRVLLVASVVFVVFMTHALLKRRNAAQRSECLRNLSAIEGAKEQFALDHQGRAPDGPAELVPLYLPAWPRCPSAGSYALGDLQTGVVCNVASHGMLWP